MTDRIRFSAVVLALAFATLPRAAVAGGNTDFAKVPPNTLAVSFRVFKGGADGKFKAITPDTPVKSGDKYYVSLRTNKPAYVYVVMLGAGGKVKKLNEKPVDQVASPECGEVRLPRVGSYPLRDGDDNIRVIATAKPLADRDLCQDFFGGACPVTSVAPTACPPKDEAEREVDPALKIGQAGASGVAEVAFPVKHQ